MSVEQLKYDIRAVMSRSLPESVGRKDYEGPEDAVGASGCPDPSARVKLPVYIEQRLDGNRREADSAGGQSVCRQGHDPVAEVW